MAGLHPIGVALDDVQPHRIGGRSRQNLGEESRRGIEGNSEGVRVHSGDAHRVGVGDHPGVELLRPGEGVHHKGETRTCSRVEQAEDRIGVVLGRHRLAVGPERVGAQGDGVDQTGGGNGVAGRTGRFHAAVGAIAVQPLHQLAQYHVGHGIASLVNVQGGWLDIQGVVQLGAGDGMHLGVVRRLVGLHRDGVGHQLARRDVGRDPDGKGDGERRAGGHRAGRPGHVVTGEGGGRGRGGDELLPAVQRIGQDDVGRVCLPVAGDGDDVGQHLAGFDDSCG